MKKLILRGLAAVMLMLSVAVPASAQGVPPQLQPVRPDTATIKGKLDNGLTYYIRHNETPKGQADFYIAQKVGSILEEEHQRGLAHFLEHMCFNGTKNFPEKGIINWLESVGVKFGQNLNAYTAIDETVYNISNVPVARTSVQDSCLLILHDWSCNLTLDPKEIDAERGVIHEEWRQRNVGQMRVLEKLLPVMYPGNRYGQRLPIGTMEVVDNFEPQALIDYYHKWYRPDNQAIIVVGDIDPAYIEGKIKEIFSPIAMPENPAERVYFPVEDTPGTIYAIGKDKEITSPGLDIMFKSKNLILPREYRDTQAYFLVSYLNSMISSMMNSRYAEMASRPGTEFSGAGISIGDFFLANTIGALDLSVSSKGNDIMPAFVQAYRELLRAARGGFTESEYDRAKANLASSLDRMYQGREHRQNGSYSKEYAANFTKNLPIPSVEDEKAIFEQIMQIMPLQAINQGLAEMITDDNRVVLGMFPEKDDVPVPTEEQIAAAVKGVEAEEIEPYRDSMREDPLIPSLPKPGKITATAHDDTWDATVFTLSNGVKVYVKKTDYKPNEIFITGLAKGKGIATLDPKDVSSVLFMPNGMAVGSYYDYSNSDVRKYLQGKSVGSSFQMDTYLRQYSGSSTVKDLPTAMELLYATFTGFDIKEDEFTAARDGAIGALANQETNPQYIFQKSMMEVMFNSPFQRPVTVNDVKAADRNVIKDIARQAMANAADYTFYFVGDIDIEALKPLLEQYVATLPADGKTVCETFTLNPLFEPNGGVKTDTFSTKMETPQTWAFIAMLGNLPYTTENKILASVASQVLSKRLLNKVREEMGAVYSIGASASMSRTSGMNTMIQSGFPMKPEVRDEVLAVIRKIIEDMQSDVTDEEVKPVIEYLQKEFKEGIERNGTWLGAMTATSVNGVNTFFDTEETLAGITPAKVQDFMKALIAQDNYRVVILNPEN